MNLTQSIRAHNVHETLMNGICVIRVANAMRLTDEGGWI